MRLMEEGADSLGGCAKNLHGFMGGGGDRHAYSQLWGKQQGRGKGGVAGGGGPSRNWEGAEPEPVVLVHSLMGPGAVAWNQYPPHQQIHHP